MKTREDNLLAAIADKSMQQKDVAKLYGACLDSYDDISWIEVGNAIIKRWSVSGLFRIKRMAWSGKCFK